MMTPVIRISITMERTDLITYVSESTRASYLEAEQTVDSFLQYSSVIRLDNDRSWCTDLLDYMGRNNIPFIDINMD